MTIRLHMDDTMNRLVETIVRHGGRCLLAGGGVIDTIRGRAVTDWDIEVYGLPYAALTDSLCGDGYRCDLVGKSFGIVKTRAGEHDVDFSIPRRENRVGAGHRGFAVDLEPGLDVRDASRRRDLTINAMYIDLHTGELIDCWGGRDDLEQGLLRAVDPATFVEDPLRVLRIMQLLPRKGRTVDPGTVGLCRSMAGEFGDLARERVHGEWRKLLMLAERPSPGLEFLRECGWIAHFPELASMIGCPQKPKWHPEGDVWTHTMLAVDAGAAVRDRIPPDWREAFMFGILLHDTGKPATTDAGLSSKGHATEGEKLARTFMRRMTTDRKLITNVAAIVREHMNPWQLHKSGAKESAWRRLHNRVRLDILGWVTRSDDGGRTGRPDGTPHSPSDMAFAYAETFGAEPIRPVLLGRHLIAAGYRPGPEFTAMLDRAYQYQMETGCTDTGTLLRVAAQNSPPESG